MISRLIKELFRVYPYFDRNRKRGSIVGGSFRRTKRFEFLFSLFSLFLFLFSLSFLPFIPSRFFFACRHGQFEDNFTACTIHDKRGNKNGKSGRLTRRYYPILRGLNSRHREIRLFHHHFLKNPPLDSSCQQDSRGSFLGITSSTRGTRIDRAIRLMLIEDRRSTR